MSKGFIYSGQHELEISVAEQTLKFFPMQDSTVRFASSGMKLSNQLLDLLEAMHEKINLKFNGPGSFLFHYIFQIKKYS
jgi:hypothetical protein